MKAHCDNCGGRQDASFRRGNDAKTAEAFVDLCCDRCNLVLATLGELAGTPLAAAPDLLAAVQWFEQFHLRQGEGYTDCFERIAEVFRRETGHLRPGKDASPMAGASIDERQAAWDKWIADGIARARAAIACASPTTVQEQKNG